MPQRASYAPKTIRPTLASTSAPAHCAHGSRVTYMVAKGRRSSPRRGSARCSASSSACAVGSRRCTVSLWASPRISPSAMITAPTGTSSLTEAARARRSAACIPVKSLGDGVPLRTGHLGDDGAVSQVQVVALALHPHGVAFVEGPLEHLQRNRVLQLALDHPLERPGAVDRVVAPIGQELARLGGHLQPEMPAGQQLLEVAQLNVHDLGQVLAAQWPEHDDIVHPIEELGPETVPELLPHPLLHREPRPIVGLGAGLDD